MDTYKIQAGIFIGVMTLLCSIAFAGTNGNFTFKIIKGEPEVEPNLASIKEDVEFKFVTKLLNKQTGQEVKPEDVKSVLYTLSSDAPEIKSCSPAITISADKMSASGSANLLQEIKAALADTTATLVYETAGDHTLTLSITVTFHDDSVLKGSAVIAVKVYKATLTVYADPPIKPEKQHDFLGHEIGICFVGDDVGHSFWKVDITPIIGKTAQTFQCDNKIVPIVGNHWGFYPAVGLKEKASRLGRCDGVIQHDTVRGHLLNAVSLSYLIKLTTAESVIAETINLNTGHKYHVLSRLAGKVVLLKQCISVTILPDVTHLKEKG